MSQQVATTGDRGQTGTFNYLAQSVRHSLYRNGEVLTRRNRDGSDFGAIGVVIEKRDMPVHDARLLPGDAQRTVTANGFELLTRPLGHVDLDFLQHGQVVGRYYDECARIVQEATDAAHVFAFDHNIRSVQGKKSKTRIEGGQQVQGPIHVVHGDYTLTSGPERLRALGRPPSGNDTFRSFLKPGQSLIPRELVDRGLQEDGRFAIINVWRNIADEPVSTHPLALCDAQSVHPEDLVLFEIHYEDRVGENYFAKHSPRHRWYYYPGITRDEVVLIKQWDSAGTVARSRGALADVHGSGDPCTFCFHSAFKDPRTPSDAMDRWSIEVRCAVLYD
jgi:hypothetical protein